jgi:hypothetical protein
LIFYFYFFISLFVVNVFASIFAVVEVSDKTGRKKESEKHENMKKNEQFCVGAIERKREMVVEGMKCDRSINACFLFDFFWGGLRRR